MARKSLAAARRASLTHARPTTGRIFELHDTSQQTISASSLLRGRRARDVSGQVARLAREFTLRNESSLRDLDATIEPVYDGTSVKLRIQSTGTIGAVPLVSPTSGRTEYGLVIQPRFEWQGIGGMLSEMGWRVIPTPLARPNLPESDRKIPAWVLATIVLFRIRALLQQLQRRFEIVQEDRRAPRGAVNWPEYVANRMSRGGFLEVPCRYPDLRDDRSLRSAIKSVLNKQLGALTAQRTSGLHVVALIEVCTVLLDRVRDVTPSEPSPIELDRWLRGSLKSDAYIRGIEAIEWTTQDRGLAGLSDLQGLPWSMSMEAFFEAWTEVVLTKVARKIGGIVKTGRQRTTTAPLRWDPPFLGSQKSLVPDVMLERGDLTVIVDAKYKEHWEEMQDRPWAEQEEDLRERHRADLLQVLAYANVAATPRIVVCLAYPCANRTWQSLQERGRAFHRASLASGDRHIDLILTAMPMGVKVDQVAELFARELTRS